MVADNNTYLYTSSDYGASFVKDTAAGVHSWYGISSSPDGKYWVAADDATNNVFISNDFGQTWVADPIAGAGSMYAAMITSDGQTIIAEDGNANGSIYESYDGGSSWTADANPGALGWFAIAGSADLSRIVASTDSSALYSGYNSALYVLPQTVPSQSYPTAPTVTTAATTPSAPNTGFGMPSQTNPLILLTGIVATVLIALGLGLSSNQSANQTRKDN